MRVAIYARRSTEEHQLTSIATQRDSAAIFAAEKGWTVVETHIDDGISGSEFERRPGLTALSRACRDHRCDVVLVRDLDRIGRDTLRVPSLVRDWEELGVAVWCYSTRARVSADDPVSIFLATAVSFARDLEARAIRSRVTEGLRRRAEKGLCVGGDVYGYARERGPDGVAYRVRDDEAAVVRELFERRAAGESIRALVLELNRRRVPSPSAGRRGTGSWAPGAVHAILTRERYIGVLTWGRTGNAYRGGTQVAITRGDADVTRVERPELAIVDADTWARVRAQDVASRGRSGAAPRHLLTGYVLCGACGGPLSHCGTRSGHGPTIAAYGCGWARDRGQTVCTASLRRPVDEVDEGLREHLAGELLSPDVIDPALRILRNEVESLAAHPDERRELLTTELARVEREAGRLAEAIASAPDLDELLPRMRQRRDRARDLRAELANLPTAATVSGWGAVEAAAREELARLREALRSSVVHAREALAALLAGTKLTAREVDCGGRRRFSLEGALHLPPRVLSASPEGPGQSARARVQVVCDGRRAA